MAKRAKKKSPQDATYDVGYGKPPEHGRIRPGEVRNPFGRNGKSKKGEDAFEKVMARETRVTIDGQVIQLNTEEAYYLKIIAMALAGGVGAARLVQEELHRRRKVLPEQRSNEELAKDAEEQEQRERLSSKLVQLLEEKAAAKKG